MISSTKTGSFITIVMTLVGVLSMLCLLPASGHAAWQHVPGWATDIGIGANGSVWVIGARQSLYEWNGNEALNRPAPEYWNVVSSNEPNRVAVDPHGHPWIIDTDGKIYRRSGGSWIHVPGWATDIGIGADGSVWVIGARQSLYKWNENKKLNRPAREYWHEVGSNAPDEVAVDENGDPWVIDTNGKIYRWE